MPVRLDDAGFEQRGVDHLAFACHLAVAKGRTDSHGEKNARGNVGHGDSGFDRGAPGTLAGDAHDAGHALGHEIKSGPITVRSAAAESADRTIDHFGIDLPDLLVAEPEPVQNPGSEVLHNDVGAVEEAPGDGDTRLCFQVERQAPLVAVEDHVRG